MVRGYHNRRNCIKRLQHEEDWEPLLQVKRQWCFLPFVDVCLLESTWLVGSTFTGSPPVSYSFSGALVLAFSFQIAFVLLWFEVQLPLKWTSRAALFKGSSFNNLAPGFHYGANLNLLFIYDLWRKVNKNKAVIIIASLKVRHFSLDKQNYMCLHFSK